MCGIVGFTGKPDSTLLEKMTSCITHRGPNDAAYIVSPSFSVGYRRLAIIDLTENIYPIKNEQDTIELVLNGEIYNYQELREELEEKGHQFVTNSDSETIVHGYEEWGEAVVDKLRGMFVFILLDKEKNELFIARDRLGIKPLYYSLHDQRVIFASEIKAIIEHFDVDRSPNDHMLMTFLKRRVHDHTEETFFKSIKRLMPGHIMNIRSDGSFKTRKYWFPEYNPEFSSKKSDEEYAKEFLDVFEESLKLHLLSDVPVGMTLSGGLDSSGIVALSKKVFDEANTITQKAKKQNAKDQLIAFSAVHPGEKVDESDYIETVVEHTGIKSVKINPQVDKFWEDFDTWLYFQEEPVISGAPYAYYSVMREAAKEVTVLISGQGGDELLAGYLPYFMTYLQSAWDNKKLWPILRETWMGKDLYFKFFIQKVLSKIKSSKIHDFTTSLNQELLDNSNAIEHFSAYSRNLNERLFEDVTKTTTPSLLRYEDKNSMANSLESRVPFFDHKVVEYVFNLPIDQKIKFGWTRYIYRNAMKGIIPEKNRTRRSKVGFTNPEWEWIERKADTFREIFSSSEFKSRKYWDAEKILADFNDAVEQKKDGDHLFFWRVFISEMWMRRFIDKI